MKSFIYEYFEEQRKAKIAHLLWLWYDYDTEQYDRTFPHVKGRQGEAMIIDGTYRSMSKLYAKNQLSYIWGISRRYSITTLEMNIAKNNSQRNLMTDAMLEDFQQTMIREEDLLMEIGLLIK